MHRQSTSIRTSDEYINMPMVSVERSSGSRKSTDNNSSDDDEFLLPLYVSTSSINGGSSKKETSTSRSTRFSVSERWIHVIPLIDFISVLILYWFSHPVDVHIGDGRIVTVRQMPVPEQFKNNTNGGNLTRLSSSASVPKNVEIKLLTSKTMPIKTNITSKAMPIITNTTSKAMEIEKSITSKAM
ncbi:uncharacterized protein LOC113322336 [Papaver somniferum]|uniref:uncharacterized protein LOC113322336 n=1 Tax=Papaver somniferum TaxID=3469 RepID=UPI000E6FBEB9|nr:uncharacterized protein LOC113322336 [Papaver somniferum]